MNSSAFEGYKKSRSIPEEALMVDKEAFSSCSSIMSGSRIKAIQRGDIFESIAPWSQKVE
jgi:hypothetical protein